MHENDRVGTHARERERERDMQIYVWSHVCVCVALYWLEPLLSLSAAFLRCRLDGIVRGERVEKDRRTR